jgi:hypothetical protein
MTYRGIIVPFSHGNMQYLKLILKVIHNDHEGTRAHTHHIIINCVKAETRVQYLARHLLRCSKINDRTATDPLGGGGGGARKGRGLGLAKPRWKYSGGSWNFTFL